MVNFDITGTTLHLETHRYSSNETDRVPRGGRSRGSQWQTWVGQSRLTFPRKCGQYRISLQVRFSNALQGRSTDTRPAPSVPLTVAMHPAVVR